MKDRKREEKLGLGQVKQREASRGQVTEPEFLGRYKKSRPVGCQRVRRIFQEEGCPRTLINAAERAN